MRLSRLPFLLVKPQSSFRISAWILVLSCSKISGRSVALCACARYTPQYGTLLRFYMCFVLKIAVAGMVYHATSASFSAFTFTSFRMYDHRGDSLLDNLMLLIMSGQRFDWWLFNFCQFFVCRLELLPWTWGCLQLCQRRSAIPELMCLAVLWLLQNDHMLFLRSSCSPSQKITFRPNFSQTCEHLSAFSQSSLTKYNSYILTASKREQSRRTSQRWYHRSITL